VITMSPRGAVWWAALSLASAHRLRSERPKLNISFAVIGEVWSRDKTRAVGNRPQEDQLKGVEDESVRALLFDNLDNYLYSTGAVDGYINIWSVRCVTHPNNTDACQTEEETELRKMAPVGTNWKSLREQMAHIRKDSVPGKLYPKSKPHYGQDQVVPANPELQPTPPPPPSITMDARINVGARVNSMVMDGEKEILYAGSEGGYIYAFDIAAPVKNVTATDSRAKMGAVGLRFYKIALSSDRSILCGVGSNMTLYNETLKEIELEDAKEKLSKAKEHSHAKKTKDTKAGFLKCWNVAGLTPAPEKIGLAPQLVVDLRSGNKLRALDFQKNVNTVVFTGGDDRRLSKWRIEDPACPSGCSPAANYALENQFVLSNEIVSLMTNPNTGKDQEVIVGKLETSGVAEGAGEALKKPRKKNDLILYDLSKAWDGVEEKAQETPACGDESAPTSKKAGNHGISVSAMGVWVNPVDKTPYVLTGGWTGMADDYAFEKPKEREEEYPPPGDNPGRIQLFDVENDLCVLEPATSLMKNGLSWVNAVVQSGESTNGGFMVSGGNDGTLIIWKSGDMLNKPEKSPEATYRVRDHAWKADTTPQPQGDFSGGEAGAIASPKATPQQKDAMKSQAEEDVEQPAA